MTRFATVLGASRDSGRAVGAFTCYNLETAEAVVSVAEARRAPVILLVSCNTFAGRSGERLLRALGAMARSATVEVLVQLDHVVELAVAQRAIELGFDAIMTDGSKLPLRENVDFTQAVCRIAGPKGVGIEAELGRVEGHEDRAERVAIGAMTEVDDAERFVRECRIDCLAVAVGNVHGRYLAVPRLDLDRLGQLRRVTDVPLSLHGASGIDDASLGATIASGIAKVNLNTELRAAYFDAAERTLPMTAPQLDLQALMADIVAALASVAEAKFELFGWASEGARPVSPAGHRRSESD